MNEIKLFNNEQFGQIRVATNENNEPLFCLADVATALRYANPAKAVIDHCKGVSVLETPTTGGIQQIKYGKESEVYRLVMKSKLPDAEAFQDWVCEEVLPSIRKTGGYIATSQEDTPELIMARALIVANNAIESHKQKLQQAEKQISTLKPKAELMEKIIDSGEKIDIGQTAKILGLPFGRNTLFKKLRELGVFFKNRNEPKQEYIDRKYFELREQWIDRNNHDGFMIVKVLVTQKGLEFINKMLGGNKSDGRQMKLV